MMMIPTRTITGPSVEPVHLEGDIKEHLRGILHTEHDHMLEGLIRSAREKAELGTGRAFVQRTVAARFTAWPADGVFELPFPELRIVESVKYTDISGTAHTFSSDNYSVDTDSEPGRVVLGYGKTWPSATLHAPDYPIEIIYVCGYKPTDGEPPDYRKNIPQNIKNAIKLLVELDYDRPPEPEAAAIKRAIDSLLEPYRIWSF